MKSIKDLLLWLALIILVMLLFLPVGLRIFGKNLYNEEEQKQEQVVASLNCTKRNETVNVTYLNGKAYNFQYLIKGNFTGAEEVTNSDNPNPDTNENITIVEEKNLVDEIRGLSEIKYRETEDVTEFDIRLGNLNPIPSEISHLASLTDASAYYSNIGFSCSSQTT